MIIKKVPKKSASKSSFKNLADYMLDLKNGNEKVEGYSFTNCNFEEINHNIKEIEMVQKQNTRSTIDKTYHMIVSFQEDENPTEEMMKHIEEELVKSIGLENHQRFSVVHGNTNNKHIHIAINKIEPETFRCIDPFQDMPKLHEQAVILEHTLNLKRDNHTPSRDKERLRAPQEIHSGIDSFKTWIKEEVSTKIIEILLKENVTWEDLHKILAEYDLHIVERANGVVIASRSSKLFIKASDVYRDLSKAKLEAKLGAFKKVEHPTKELHKFGTKAKEENSYWTEYQKIKKERDQQKSLLIPEQRKRATAEKNLIYLDYKIKREATLNNHGLTSSEKKTRYREIQLHRKKSLAIFSERNKNERDDLYSKIKNISYKEFLIEKSLSGDTEALDLLRQISTKESKTLSSSNTLEGKTTIPFIDLSLDPKVTKFGDVVYSLGGGVKLIDKGKSFKLTELTQESQYLQTLLLAKQKFGKTLDVGGSEEFKKNMILIATKYKLDIKFHDKTMENIRATGITLERKNYTKEKFSPTKHPIHELKTLKQKIGDKHHAKRDRRGSNITHDQRGGDDYFTSTRAYIASTRSKLEDLVGHIRDFSSTGGEAIRERIIDVFNREDRILGAQREINPNSNTRTAADRE